MMKRLILIAAFLGVSRGPTLMLPFEINSRQIAVRTGLLQLVTWVKITICLLIIQHTIHKANAQSHLGLSIGTSKSDKHIETLWYQQQLSEKFSIGLQLKVGDYKYRFVNARPVSDEFFYMLGVPFGIKINESANYRIDFNVTPSWRRINTTKESGLKNSTAIEIDPNLIFSVVVAENTFFHSGVLLRTVFQLRTEGLFEQQPSGIILTGITKNVNNNLLTLRTYLGPMSGANGDTEKFFWQVSLGFQKSLGLKKPIIPFINF